jgi:heptosyltransferase-2
MSPFLGGNPGTILVRAVNWLGDAVMTTPALAALRAACPGSRITILAMPLVADLLRGHPDVDEVLVYDRDGAHRGPAGKLRMASALRARRFDAAVLLQNAFDAALLAFLARIPARAGYATDGRRMLLTRAVDIAPGTMDSHEVEYYLALLAGLGVPRPAAPALRLAVSAEEREAMEARLRALGAEPGRTLLGINPGATYGSAKRWFPERFAAVADALAAEWDAAVVLLGSAKEAPLSDEIEGAMSRRPVKLTGKTTVREMMALIARCDFLVTNDSGPMHVAAALGTPLTAIFGPTEWRRTSPYTDKARLVRAEGVPCAPCKRRECDREPLCMLGVTPGMVIEASIGLYREAGRGRK